MLGVLPGGGAVLSSFAAYSLERKWAKDPSRFGKGAVEGVAGPESANNAGAQTSFIPMLTLGIPPNAVMAVMIGAMMIHGIRPGPEVLDQRPELFWGLIASMWVGNVMLVVINLPLIGIWVRLLRVPYRLLFPAILLFSSIGVYSVHNSTFEVVLAAGFGVFGYVLLQARLRAGAARARFRARADAGGTAAHRHAARPRQSDDFPGAADQRRVAAHRGRIAGRRAAAQDPPGPRRGLSGVGPGRRLTRLIIL